MGQRDQGREYQAAVVRGVDRVACCFSRADLERLTENYVGFDIGQNLLPPMKSSGPMSGAGAPQEVPCHALSFDS